MEPCGRFIPNVENFAVFGGNFGSYSWITSSSQIENISSLIENANVLKLICFDGVIHKHERKFREIMESFTGRRVTVTFDSYWEFGLVWLVDSPCGDWIP